MSLDLLKTIPQYLIPKHKLTAFSGFVASIKNTRIKNYIIRRFIKKYGVKMQEALVEDPSAYASFNDFFIRHLKPELRPLAEAAIVSPVDGCVSEIGSINEGQLVQAKGRFYTLYELFGNDEALAKRYLNGKFATLYLSPKDYHRVHMPLDAELMSMTYIPGVLFSVSPNTARIIPKLFSRNERLVISFETHLGPMAMVLVGATIVGAIGTSWHGDLERSKSNQSFHYERQPLKQGDELAYFKLGSTVILLFANGKEVQWKKTLVAGSTLHFGEAIGDFNPEKSC